MIQITPTVNMLVNTNPIVASKMIGSEKRNASGAIIFNRRTIMVGVNSGINDKIKKPPGSTRNMGRNAIGKGSLFRN